jgi:hypothetical protein
VDYLAEVFVVVIHLLKHGTSNHLNALVGRILSKHVPLNGLLWQLSGSDGDVIDCGFEYRAAE